MFLLFLVIPFIGLYTTFIFQKPDPDVAPPLATPLLQDDSFKHDEASISDLTEVYNARIAMPCCMIMSSTCGLLCLLRCSIQLGFIFDVAERVADNYMERR